MRFVYVMDPLSVVTHDKDTTFSFIESAQKRGHENLHCLPADVMCRPVGPGDSWKATAAASVRPLRITKEPPYIEFSGAPEEIDLRDVDAIFIRKDPPFHQEYLYLTQILDLARGGPLIVNDPRGLRDANEKLYTLHFTQWMPKTMVASSREVIRSFVDEVGGKAVIKPLDGAGGSGVMMLRKDDKNARAIVDALTHDGTALAMVQAFMPSVTEGDKRILLLDGEPLGAILRIPRGDDLRSNIHVGGTVAPTELTAREREIVSSIAPRLRADGLYFVGLDVIGEHLTEVNVTSPTGIQELSRFLGRPVSDDVMAWVESKRLQSA